ALPVEWLTPRSENRPPPKLRAAHQGILRRRHSRRAWQSRLPRPGFSAKPTDTSRHRRGPGVAADRRYSFWTIHCKRETGACARKRARHRQAPGAAPEESINSAQKTAHGNDAAKRRNQGNVPQARDRDAAETPQAIVAVSATGPTPERERSRHDNHRHDRPFNPAHRNVNEKVGQNVLRESISQPGHQGGA